MFIVGLTGGIATGKSTVSEVFREHGIPVVDADQLARKVVEPGKRAWKCIKTEFGDDVFHENGTLNREVLGLAKLDEVVSHEQMPVQFLQFPSNLASSLLKILTNHKEENEEDLQLQRLMDRNSMSESRAKQRIGAQMSLERKCEKAHFVVENSGTVEDTRQQVIKIISILRGYRAHWKLRVIAALCCTGIVSLLLWIGSRVYLNHYSAITR